MGRAPALPADAPLPSLLIEGHRDNHITFHRIALCQTEESSIRIQRISKQRAFDYAEADESTSTTPHG